MARDPLAAVEDAPLFIVPRVLDALRAYREESQCDDPPGDDASVAGARMMAELDGLVDRLLAGVGRHPTKFWVMKQFQSTLDALDALDSADASARRQVRTELERLMEILGIASSDGVLGPDFR